MLSYTARRLMWAVLVLLVVAFLTFLLIYILPADPARMIAGPNASAADVARIRHALGLDRPFLEQLADYFSRLLHGDFGFSYNQHQPVLSLILGRLPATGELAVAGILIELAIGVPLGVVAAVRRGTNFDRAATIGSAVLVAAPSFWVGYLLILLFAFEPLMNAHIAIFPLGGYRPLDLRYLFLPAFTLGISGAGYYVRLTRSTMIDELNRDYIRTARAKGLSTIGVVVGHALRNAIAPVLMQLGLDMGMFLGGVVAIENVFSWPGIGRLAVQSIVSTDTPLIMGTVIFGTFFIVIANLAVDITYAIVDPRVRLQRGRS